MNVFRRIFSADFWRDIVSAFRIYPLSAIISLFATALLIADIMDFAPIAIKWRFFALIAFCLALGVESVVSSLRGARSATKQSKKIIDCHEFANANSRNDDRVDCFGDESPRNDGVWQIAKFATFALIATPIYFYIAQSVENIASPTHIAPPTFLLHYLALCVIFALIFVALNLEKSFRSLYNATIRAIFLCVVCGLFGVLLFVFASLCDMLFGVSIYRFALSVEICALEAIFLLFLATFKRDIEAHFGIILRILNIFATLYVAVFLLYFIGVFAFSVESRVSIVHLVVWYGFFALFLWWLNMAKMGESLGESRESNGESAHESKRILDKSSDLKRESAPKIPRILTRFAPLGALFALNIIAFYAIILRIAQYGVTIERYFVVVGCVALLVNLAFSAFCKKPIAKGIVAIIVLVAFSAFGGKFNAIDLSLNSQYKELEKARNSGDGMRIANIESFIMRYNSDFTPSAILNMRETNIYATFDDALYVFPLESRYKAILQVDCCADKARESGGYFYDIDSGDLRIFKDSAVIATINLLDLAMSAKMRYESGENGIIYKNGITIMLKTIIGIVRYADNVPQSVTITHLSGTILVEK